MDWNRPEIDIPQDIVISLNPRYFSTDGESFAETESITDITLGTVAASVSGMKTGSEPETGLAGNELEINSASETENIDPINIPEPNEALVGLLSADALDPGPEDALELEAEPDTPAVLPEADSPEPEPIKNNIQINTIDTPVDRSDVLRRREAPDLPKYSGKDNTPIILSPPDPEPHLPPNSPWAVCSPPAAETRTDRFLFRLMVEPSRRWTITLINTDTAERKNHASGSGGIPAMNGQIYTGLEFARLRGMV